MKRIGLPDLLGDLFDTASHDVTAILSSFYLLRVLLRDIGNDALVWQFVDQTFLEYFVDFIASQLHRRNSHRLTSRLLLQIRDGGCERLRLGLIAAREV